MKKFKPLLWWILRCVHPIKVSRGNCIVEGFFIATQIQSYKRWILSRLKGGTYSTGANVSNFYYMLISREVLHMWAYEIVLSRQFCSMIIIIIGYVHMPRVITHTDLINESSRKHVSVKSITIFINCQMWYVKSKAARG